MPKPSPILTQIVIFIGGAGLLGGVFFVYTILGSLGLVWTPYTCLTDLVGKASTPAGHFAAGVISVIVAAYPLNWLWMMLGTFGVVWSPYNCLTEPLGKTSDPAGFRFLISQTTRSGIGKGPTEVSVFASKTGLMRRRTLIFKYESMADDSRDAEPVIEPSVDNTVRISVKHVAMIICQSTHRETLAVAYDIGRVVRSSGRPLGECAQE
jgi:hypothetical protein